MIKILPLLILLSPALLHAKYFRPLDLNNPHFTTGVFSDYKGNYDGGGALALITHSKTDGCLISGFCIDWTPLAIGGTLGRGLGGPTLGIGPSANLLPVGKSILLGIVNAMTSDGEFVNVKDSLKEVTEGQPDVKFAVGPSWALAFTDGLRSKGVWLWFAGGEWQFGGK